eukprot:1841085-Rhodomonas_salina.1
MEGREGRGWDRWTEGSDGDQGEYANTPDHVAEERLATRVTHNATYPLSSHRRVKPPESSWGKRSKDGQRGWGSILQPGVIGFSISVPAVRPPITTTSFRNPGYP